MRRLQNALLALSLALLPLRLLAMDIRPCSDPVVFSDAAVNALVLPWRAQAGPQALQDASRQMSALAQLQLLMSMLKFGSIGVVDLVAEPGRVCDVDQVLNRVSRTGVASGRLKAGQGVVVLWGRLFEQDGEIFLQSYLRFARQGVDGLVPEVLKVPLRAGDATLELQAALPAQALSFAPRRIRLEDLARIDAAFRAALRVRPAPDLDAPGVEIGRSTNQSFPYWVAESRGDWLRLAPMRPGLPAGWVRARTGDDTPEWSLSRWLPELDFAEGVAGWLRLRTGGVPTAQRQPMADAALAALARYERAVPAELAPNAWAVAAGLRGQLAWVAEQRDAAGRQFTLAAQRLPGGAAARQAAAVMMAAQRPLDGASAKVLADELLAVLALDPNDTLVRANLKALYRLYAQRPDWSPFTAEELATRQQVLGG
ncbi:hypothetical protein [Pelomonas sp. Root1237]|uniref:hypothetical protein n=1 Tax=Pelomonas sp. Root1237 TaxID=1736434 RepID=UPI0006FFE9F4|nr:hypothetical protein [Pelomonas sp. Root1237]KQV95551.1 hypothetical protein ASC91_24890 [Pelomonas sp. Root1237]